MQTSRRKLFTLLSAAVLTVLVVSLLATGATNAGARPQEITGASNHIITLDQATKYIKNYSVAPTYAIKGAYFDKSIFEKILAQTDCVGIRYYYGRKDDGTPCIVLVGVDSKGSDIAAGILGDDAIPCPPLCPPFSPLTK
jgi:hypothetical protein